MAIQDTRTRKETPVRIVPLGYNGNAGSDLNIKLGQPLGDLTALVSANGFQANVGIQNAVRIPKPRSGEITELYLTFRLRIGTNESGTRKLWIGYADADPADPMAVKVMDTAVIKAAHATIFGSAAGLQATAGNYMQFNRLNIGPLIKRGVPGKGWHGLVFLFDQDPVTTYDGNNQISNGYGLEVFRLDGAVRFKGTL